MVFNGKQVSTLVELLCERANENGMEQAFAFMADGENVSASLTFGELHRRACSIALRLRRAGIEEGARVLIVLGPGLDFICAFFGCVYAGMIAVPAVPPSNAKTLPRLLLIQKNSAAAAVIATKNMWQQMHDESNGFNLDGLLWFDGGNVSDPDGDWYPPAVSPLTPAFIQYTSGSTGTPKGVIVTHGNVIANVAKIHSRFALNVGDTLVSWLPPFHDMGLIGMILYPVYSGSRCVQFAPAAFLARPVRWLAALSRFKARGTAGPDFAYALCASKVTPDQLNALNLASVDFMLSGAEPVRSSTVRAFVDAFSACGLKPEALVPVYGLAEATLFVAANESLEGGVATTLAVDRSDLNANIITPAGADCSAWVEFVSVGTGMGQADAPIIVSPETRLAVAQGRVGEIWVTGDSVAPGYWGLENEAGPVFRARLADGPDGEFLRTGDLGFWHEGRLFISGRIKDTIILNGRNIYPSDIEETVENLDASFRPHGCAVFEAEGRDGAAVAVIQEIQRRSDPDFAALDSIIRAELLESFQILQVATIAFVKSGRLPRTSSGKIQRSRCRDMLRRGEFDMLWCSQAAPDRAAGELPAGPVVPSTPTEVALLGIIARLLPDQPISITDDFFSLGGHSLLAMQVSAGVREKFGVDLSPRTLFGTPSLLALAREIDSKTGQPLPAGTPDSFAGLAQAVESIPLSAAQRRLWFVDRLNRTAGLHQIQFAVRLEGQIDAAALAQSLHAIVGRHASLRTRFLERDGIPEQHIDASVAVPFGRLDLGMLPPHERDLELARVLALDAGSPIDLAHAPLARFQLIRLSDRCHLLLMNFHHLVFDGWSMRVFLQELGHFYQKDGGAQARELSASYADFAIWENQPATQDGLGSQLQYWLGQLDGISGQSPLADLGRKGAPAGFAGASHRIVIPADLANRLRALARDHATTPYTVLLTAFYILLRGYSAEDDLCVGSPVANREFADAQPLIGLFVNTVILRARFDPESSFLQMLEQVRGTVLDALTHQRIPYDHVVSALRSRHKGLLSHGDLFHIMFVLQDVRPQDLLIEGINVSEVPLETALAKFDLSLEIREYGGGLSCEFVYKTDLFDSWLVKNMAGHFSNLLQAIVDRPDTSVADLPLLSEPERNSILNGLNETTVPLPGIELVHELFERQAAVSPEALALTGGAYCLSYAELNRLANQLAHRLIALGVKPDDRVALFARHSSEEVVAMLGILKAGAAYVPLDPHHPPERLAFLLADSAPVVILMQDDLSLQVDDVASAIPVVYLNADSFGTWPIHNPAQLNGKLTRRNLGGIIYTSGSTGVPKGVMVEHGNILNIVQDWRLRFGAVSGAGPFAASLWTNISFDVALFEIFIPLAQGGTIHVVPDPVRASCDDLFEWLYTSRIEFGYLPPFFVRHLDEADDARIAALNLKQVMVGAESFLESSLFRLRSLLPSLTIVNAYGPTEATVLCSTYADIHDLARNAPIGRPIANTRMHILDSRMQPVPTGVKGEIWIGGAGVARGYLNRPEMTAGRFVRNPFLPGATERLYRSGDLGRYLPDGNIEFLGRSDFQVKMRGFRIEPGEIEARLAACAQVREAVVLVREDQPGDQRLVAYVVAREGAELLPSALRTELAHHLPEYMVPAAFVSLAALPLTPSGKLDRKALPAPVKADMMVRSFRAPEGELEQTIAAVWQSLLGLEQVGRDDHFFELGGHSLLAARLVSRVRQLFGVELALRDVFVDATVAGMAALVGQAKRSTLPAIVAAPRDGALPLSWAQQRLWFLSQLDAAAGAAYHMPAALRLVGRLDLAALQRSLNRIVARHESLRTRFVNADGAPEQVIDPDDIGFALEQRDLSALDEVRRAQAVSELGAQEARQPFDLERGPLIRGVLLRLADDEHVMLLTQHHIISDGWSVGVLVHEVSTLYAAFSQSLPDPLPALGVQYADYALWQRKWLQGALLENQLQFWKNHLAGAPELLDMPTDHPRPPVQSYRGSSVPVLLPVQLVESLRALSQQHQTTLFMTLLAGWAVLLSRLSGQNDVVIGTAVANRQHAEIEPLIGFFVNTLALRIKLDADPDVAQLLAQVRATTLDAYTHQELPFDQVVEAVKPARNLGHAPLFQVMFAFEAKRGQTSLSLPGLALSVLETPEYSAHFDLNLSLTEEAGAVAGYLEYASDLFERPTMERLTDQFNVLLAEMAAHSKKHASELDLLSPQARQQLLDFNPPRVHCPGSRLLHQLFEKQAAARPDAVAVEYEGEQLTCGELNRRANRLAHHLLALGVRPDDRVALCAARSIGMVVALLGIIKAGAAYVPLDPVYPKDRLAYMLSDSAPVAVLTQPGLLDGLTLPACPLLLIDDDSAFGQADEHNIDPASLGLTPDKLAYLIYTSGSTGLPKGAMVEHAGLHNLLDWYIDCCRFSAMDRVLVLTSFSFDLTQKNLWASLVCGAQLHLARPEFDPHALGITIGTRKISAINLTPSTFYALIESEAQATLASLRWVILGGEPINTARIAPILARYPGLEILNSYGPTECTDVSAFHHLRRNLSSYHAEPPIGKPVSNVRLYVLDKLLQPVPLGVIGEIFVGGAGVGRGYLNRGELTAERFVPDPFTSEPGARMYQTGDLGRYLPNGDIEYLGRSDFQVKIRGFRIEPGEIEARLAACAQVREAAVLAREDQPGDKRLVAYVVAREGAQLLPSALRAELAHHLPEYMVPAAFVAMAALPLTPSGKLDRKALPAPAQADLLQRAFRPPEGAFEQTIASVWQSLLGLERVGRDDNFFELGGHSLLAVRLVSRVRQLFGVELALRDVFVDATVPGMAALVARAKHSTLPAIVAAPRDDALPLSWAQQRLWFLSQLDAAAGAAYHMPVALRLAGWLDLPALQRSLNRIVARHESLRTRFVNADGAPVQVIDPADIGFSLQQRDLSSLDEVQRARAVSELGAQEARQPFDLERGPLIRGVLLRLADDEHVMLLTQHHIISDGWSVGVLVHEVSTLYAAFSQGLPDPLPALSMQYADYALWQRQWLQGALLENQLQFWKNHLAGAPELLAMPTDHPRPPVQSYRGARLPVLLPVQLVESLRALSQQHQTTLFMTLLAGWAVLLSRLSGQHDVVIGTAVANRQHAEIEPLIGFFVNTLALRIKLDADPDVAQLLAQVRAMTLDAYTHQELPFDQVVEAVKPARNLGHAPLFQVMFAFEAKRGQASLSLPGLALSALETPEYSAHFDLSLSLSEDAGMVGGELEYASDLFERSTIERLTEQFGVLLGEMVANSEKRSSELNLLSPQARQQLLLDFNATRTSFSQSDLVHQLFEAQVAARPDAVALEYEGEQLAYGELNRRANRLAHQLLALGVRPDDRVALCAQRSIGMVVALLGIIKAGAAYVPLDPLYPKERLAYMLSDSMPVAVLSQSGLLDGVPLPACPLLLLDDGGSELAHAGNHAEHNIDPASIGLSAGNLAYVIYTSGSTGLPKGVMVEHRSLLNLWQGLKARIFHTGSALATISAALRVSLNAAISFDASLQSIVQLLSGNCIVLIPQAIRSDAAAMVRFLKDYQVNVLDCTPSQLELLLEEGLADSETLKVVLVGGEAISRPMWQTLKEIDRIEFYNVYGPTECTVDATAGNVRSLSALPSIGSPIANTRIYILDNLMQPVPVGVAGEIFVGGAGVARGYLNRPELTAERFVRDPFTSEPGARMYQTGDLGRYLPDGNIEYLGRSDFQVKIRGFRIELGEIEARLAACAQVREAVVLAREDQPGDKRLVAYVVAREGAQLLPSELRAELAQHLPEYMVPAAFVSLAVLPLTPSGKLDRKALPAPGQADVMLRTFRAPEGEFEQTIASVWQSLLGLEQVGRDDNFFELGGHSLLAVRLVSRVRQLFGVELALRDVFMDATVPGMAALVARATRSTLPAIMAAPRDGALPLSWAQQRLWFLSQLDAAAGAAYHMPVALRLAGRLDLPALQRSLNRIVARHESLRTRFVNTDGVPVQVIDPADIGFALEQRDFSALAPELKSKAVSELGAEEASQPFDLERGPLIRGILLRLADDEHVMLLTQHHIITDGWSVGVLVQEVSTLYAAFSQGLPDPLPALSVQYADYALWQRQWLQGALLENQLQFWKNHLAGAPELLDMPTDHPRPPIQSYRGSSVPVLLPAQLVDGLRNLSQQHQTTLFMTLLAGWAVLLSRLSGQSDVVIGTAVANRQHAEIEPLIGFFVNTLALRIKLDADPDVAQLLAQVRATTLDAYTHQELPFDQVVEALKPARNLGHAPLFQAMFAFEAKSGQANLSLPGLALSLLETPEYSAHFDLSLSLTENAGMVGGELEYASDLFERSTMERLTEQFCILLGEMVANSEKHCSELNLLSPQARQQLWLDFNPTRTSFAKADLVHQLFEAQAAARADAVALEYEGEQLVYGELNRRANRLAHQLLALGVRPDDRVALCARRSIGMVVALLGIIKAGAAYVPLDPLYPKERLAYMLSDSAPVAVLSQPGLLDGAALPACPLLLLDESGSETGSAGQPTAEHNIDPASIGLTPDKLAYVIYTSGSTGLPKGVMAGHGGLGNLALAQIGLFGVSATSRVLQFASFSFDASISEIMMALCSGAVLVLAPRERLLPGTPLLSTLEQAQITHVTLPSSALSALTPEGVPARRMTLILAGDVLRPDVAGAWAEQHHLFNAYGPTEATVCATAYRWDGRIVHSVPIGKPIANVRCYLLDRHSQPVPVGVAGELWIGGAGVARGYLNRPDLTDERFVADPFDADGGRLYKTGDLGRYLPDGNIEFLGRSDFQVKIRGFRIELGEIEARLAACARVREAAVLAHQAAAAGDQRLVAYVVPQEGASLVAAELRTELAQYLPEFMLPAAFVMLDAFPLTPNGKLDRKALLGHSVERTVAVRVEPRTGNEKFIAACWMKLLHLNQVGVDENFFEIGGNSLLMIQLHRELQVAFPDRLALVDLFKYPTITSLVRFLEKPVQSNESSANARIDRRSTQAELAKRRSASRRQR